MSIEIPFSSNILKIIFFLKSHPDVTQAGIDALRTHGAGLSSVRFICGTQDIHKTLEKQIAQFHGREDSILYARQGSIDLVTPYKHLVYNTLRPGQMSKVVIN